MSRIKSTPEIIFTPNFRVSPSIKKVTFNDNIIFVGTVELPEGSGIDACNNIFIEEVQSWKLRLARWLIHKEFNK